MCFDQFLPGFQGSAALLLLRYQWEAGGLIKGHMSQVNVSSK